MKNKFIIFSITFMLVVLMLVVFMFASCDNKRIIDTTYKFDYVQIEMPNGTIVEGKVESWKDFDDGDQMQVTINGETYLTHISRMVMIDRKG